MNYLKALRQLADLQQFASLQANAEQYWQETADPRVLPLLALALTQLGRREQAESVLSALDEEALDHDGKVDLAGVWLLWLRLEEASALLEAVLAAQPDYALALARLAWCRLQAGRLSEARSHYERSARLEPARLPVFLGLARLCLQQHEPESAQRAVDQGIEQLGQQREALPEAAIHQFTTQLRGLQLEIWVESDQRARAEEWLAARRDSLAEEDWVGLVIGYATLLAARDCHAEAEEMLREATRYYRENLALNSQLAELAQIQGRIVQTVHLLRRAIRLARRDAKPEVVLWVRLSAACLHGMDEQARKAAETALDLANGMEADAATPEPVISQIRLQAKNALASVESQDQHFDTAEKLFREVLADNPWFLPALQGLGQQQMQLGKIDDAIELFERIRQIDPAKGISSLINARRFPEDEQTLQRLEALARRPSLEGRARSGILFQLAAAWEKRGAFDQAFAMASEANEASRKFLRYDPKEHRQRCARIRYAFSRSLYEHRKGYGSDSTLPVFVVGMPRSGTTLVEQILAGHSRIFGAGELGFIPSRIQGLNRWERRVGSGRSYPDCIDDLSPYVTEGVANGILDELREFDPKAKHIVDKLPHNFENLGFIKFLFPNAKIISVRRDPRDIALSNFFTDYQAKHGGMGFAYDPTWIGEQLADHNLLMHHWHQVFPGEILEVQYERVVDNTEAEARRMLDYIGVAWEPQVLAFNELERPVKTASVWQVRQPIYTSSKAKWKRYQAHLAPLIRGTNAKIEWEPIEMLSLPEPGMLGEGVALIQAGKLDEAEYRLKQLLHHLPEHAAANFMVGQIYARKGHWRDAIVLMEKAHEKCPWNSNWRQDLILAYEMVGELGKAEALRGSGKENDGGYEENADPAVDEDWNLDLDSSMERAERTFA